jgi:hypothetical protein
MPNMLRAGIALAFFFTLLPACASDAAPEPEADLETPGAFFAMDEGKGALALARTLTTLRALPLETGDTILFFTLYDVAPSTWDEAHDIAQGHDIPIRILTTTKPKSQLIMDPYRVVWFRSLTDEERERIP